MSRQKTEVELYSRQTVGQERRTRVRLTPGTYDRTEKEQVVLHQEVDVDEIEKLIINPPHHRTPYWDHDRYDWETAKPVPLPEPPPPSALSRLGWWLLSIVGIRRQPALPPARVVDNSKK